MYEFSATTVIFSSVIGGKCLPSHEDLKPAHRYALKIPLLDAPRALHEHLPVKTGGGYPGAMTILSSKLPTTLVVRGGREDLLKNYIDLCNCTNVDPNMLIIDQPVEIACDTFRFHSPFSRGPQTGIDLRAVLLDPQRFEERYDEIRKFYFKDHLHA
jgi:hypothetical protein